MTYKEKIEKQKEKIEQHKHDSFIAYGYVQELRELQDEYVESDEFDKDVEQGIISPYEAEQMRKGRYRKPK